jgi:hypothetical protein
MKIPFKLFAIGVALAASSSLAYASPLTAGSLTIDGGVGALIPSTLSASTTSISPGGTIIALGSSGGLSSVSAFSPITFSSLFTFIVGGTPVGGEQLFSFAFGTGTETFDVNSVYVAPNGSLMFYGVLSDGILADNTPGSYILTPNNSADGSFSSTLDATPTPEPSSLILLGTGLAGAAGLLFRKRRKLV